MAPHAMLPTATKLLSPKPALGPGYALARVRARGNMTYVGWKLADSDAPSRQTWGRIVRFTVGGS